MCMLVKDVIGWERGMETRGGFLVEKCEPYCTAVTIVVAQSKVNILSNTGVNENLSNISVITV